MKSKDIGLTATLPQSAYSYKHDYLKYSVKRIYIGEGNIYLKGPIHYFIITS